jgi:hypothetical protein
MKACVLAPGHSMSAAVADSVRNCPAVIAVGNVGIDFAPWAHALCSQDRQWWLQYPQAHQFAGRKFSTRKIEGVETIDSDRDLLSSASNSGALALIVAHRIFAATEIDLHGFDMHGSHYFGKYKEPLRNTAATRFNEFQHQFAAIGKFLEKEGIRVLNRTPGSALRCFPISVGTL